MKFTSSYDSPKFRVPRLTIVPRQYNRRLATVVSRRNYYSDINRELKCFFVRVNFLNRRFGDARLKSNFGFIKPSAGVFMILICEDFTESELYENLLLRM